MDPHNIATVALPIQEPDAPDVAAIVHRAYCRNTPVAEVLQQLRPAGDNTETREALLREWLRFSEFFRQLQLRMDAVSE
jgi:hypothetical protein